MIRTIMASWIALALALIGGNAALAGPPGKTYREGRVLVKPHPGLSDFALATILAAHGGREVERLHDLDVRVVDVPPQAEEAVAHALAQNPQIDFAEPDALVEPNDTVPNDPDYGSAWHLPKIQAPGAWDVSRGGGVVIAILDTGVDGSHPDLAGKMLPGWNSVDQNADTADIFGHGTAVAGTAAAATNNGTGVASVAWDAQILPVRITDRSDGAAYYSDMANGLTWAADHGARVANISYDATPSATVANAAAYMRSRGGLVVVAAGNSGTDPGYADSPYMISVSATTSSDTRASWSSYGNYVDVSAPGSSILTTNNGGGYGHWSGTSFASPVTAGVVALIMAANPDLGPDQVESVLETTATDLGSSGWDSSYGWGRVNADAAVMLAVQTAATDTQAPSVSIMSPSAGSSVSGQVLVDVVATDNVGVSSVSLYVNGKLVGTDDAAPYEFSWDSQGVADGTVTLGVTAVDAAGNQGGSSETVDVANAPAPAPAPDTEAPQVGFTSPADGATVSGNVGIAVAASDNVGVTSLMLYIDGNLKSVSSSGTLSYKWNARKASSGSHILDAVASDAAGNASETSIAVNIGGGSTSGGGGGSGKGKH
jgi:hypothetical protein